MKKIISVLCILCCTLSLTSCALFGQTAYAPKSFEIESYAMTLTADSSYSRGETEEGSWDLQITDEHSYISVMCYYDYETGDTPEELYALHNNDIMQKRENVTLVKEMEKTEKDGAVILHTVYTASLDGVKNYYSSYMFDFDGAMAWLLITSGVSNYKKNSEKLDGFAKSLVFSGKKAAEEKVFDIPKYGLTFTANGEYEIDETEGDWDLTVSNDYSIISFICYHDYQVEMTADEVYEIHDSDIFEDVDTVTVVSRKTETINDSVRIISTVYSEDLGEDEMYYYTYMFDFDGVMAWVFVSMTAEYHRDCGGEVDGIVRSLKLAA